MIFLHLLSTTGCTIYTIILNISPIPIFCSHDLYSILVVFILDDMKQLFILSLSILSSSFWQAYSLSSLTDQDYFLWAQQAEKLSWQTRWHDVVILEGSMFHWFAGGTINACHECLDLHIKSARGDAIAISWSNELSQYKTLTYTQLYESVNKFSAYLLNHNVKAGDIVIIYMPMIPEAIAAMLACSRIGAVHCVVFSGFSYQALHDRIIDTQARLIITADVGYYRGKAIDLKSTVDQAVDNSSIQTVIIIRRTGRPITCTVGRDYIYQEQQQNKVYVQPVYVESNHPLFILYTSGTTGKPKGIIHSTGGYLTYVYATLEWAFGIKPDDVYWCTADIGWITGHSYVVYGPLMHGATIVVREGAPDYPDARAWWQLIDRLKINIFYTAPTALRMFMRLGSDIFNGTDLTSLRVLGSVGEPINPEVWRWYYETVGHRRCPVVDTWWQTETGGFMIAPQMQNLVSLKPGSATMPMPGIAAKVVDSQGAQVAAGTKGYLVITKPWPGMAIGIHNDQGLFKEIYFSKIKDVYYTGDYASQDKEGYFWLLGRADEVIKVAGHRIGTAEIESVVLEHRAVAENAVVGVHDPIKGEAIVVFVVLKKNYQPYPQLEDEIIQVIRMKVGAFAAPRKLYYVEKLPKTRSGKIMRRLLKALVEGFTVGDISTLEDELSLQEIQQMILNIKEQKNTESCSVPRRLT